MHASQPYPNPNPSPTPNIPLPLALALTLIHLTRRREAEVLYIRLQKGRAVSAPRAVSEYLQVRE